MNPFSKAPFTNAEATGTINEGAIGAFKGAGNLPSCFLFRVLLFQ